MILKSGCPADKPGKLLKKSPHTLEILIELYGVGLGIENFLKTFLGGYNVLLRHQCDHEKNTRSFQSDVGCEENKRENAI